MRDVHVTTLRRLRGAAMIETVLVLPVVVAILLMVIYFGRELVRLQRVQVMATYDAWRVADDGTGPWSDNATNNELLNQLFLGEKAVDENGDSTIQRLDDVAPYPDGATRGLVDAAAFYSTQTMTLADRRVTYAPDGVGRRFKVSWPVELAYWVQFESPITQGHTRVKDEWKANDSNGGVLAAVGDTFMTTLDNPLDSTSSGLAQALQDQYRREPGYVGPTINAGP